MMKTDILIIGGSAAGQVSAMTAKSAHPEKNVTLIRREEKVMIPCGIPYIFGTLGSSDKNISPDAGLEKLGINIFIDEVLTVNKDEKICKTKKEETFSYDKLIFATGSEPMIMKFIPGHDKENAFTIPKNKVYLDVLQQKLDKLNKIIVIGAGFIGVEISDELNKKGKEITLIELLPNIMASAFDPEFSELAEKALAERGVKVLTGIAVKEITGDKSVNGVILNDGSKIEAEAVIMSCGYKPNTALAKETGLVLNEYGFIQVDRYMRTNIEDIYAIGDCAEKREFSTGKLSKIMLASTACAEARVAALNLYELSTVNTFRGTIGIYSTNIGNTSYGVAGLTEAIAREDKFDIITGSFTGVDRHPGHLEDASPQMVKLIIQKKSGAVLGGEVYGGKSVGELINVIGFAIQADMTINDLLVAQIGTQPMLTASPAAYPLIKAAEICAKKMP
jgi:pyruvate/2-oxoglutarate dehydrogenase complex dihydrolipoamide dehydrogenase (E3) component